MKRIILAASLLACMAAVAAEAPLWLRQTAISPDGTTIAFAYKGDIFTVPSNGGRATQLTASPAYDANPFFSPDGSRIVFNSNRNGSNDIFVVDTAGGTPVRLTTHSGSEVARGWLNDSTVVFSADIMPSPEDLNGPFFIQTYTVAARSGARPAQLVSLQMDAISANASGDILFQNHKSYENALRKHEYSAGTPDVYLLRDSVFTRLTTTQASGRNPVWLGADRFAYTADDSCGVLNIYEAAVDGSGAPRRLTSFDRHPVRSLSASADGSLLAFSHDGEIYTLRPGGEPVKVDVQIAADDYDPDQIRRFVTLGADNMSVSPTGKEVAFTLRGDLYVTSVKYETTKRITDTSGQERVSSFSDDGRALVYDSERNGLWSLYIARLSSDNDKNFTYASAPITEEVLYTSDKAAQQPLFSPDGKKVAFLEDRTELKVIDVESRLTTTVLPARFNYSYSDGDISFEWSPDSKWLLVDYIGTGGWNNKDIALVKADGTEVVDLTESGYEDSEPHWALDGRAITYTTGRYGMRSHGSWGNQSDVMLMVLDGEAWDEFNMTKEEAALAEEAEESSDDDDDDSDDKGKKKKNKKEDAEEDTEAVVFDLRNRRHRMIRLTERSSNMGNHFLSPKGDKLYYLAAATEGSYKLYVHDLKEDETSVLAGGLRGGFVPDVKGENLYFITGSGMTKLDLASGDTEDIEFEAPYGRRPSQEREYIYDHVLQQVRDKFYDPELHGTDWDGFGEQYRRFLPHIANNQDFAQLLSELLGELNASHTGASAYSTGMPSLLTASLGAYYDPEYSGDGLRVLKLLPRSPLGTAKANVQPGDIIVAIDGDSILAGADYFPLLDGKGGRKTTLTIREAGGAVRDVTVKPINSDVSRIYQEWVERNEALVDSLSGGRIGYVHIEGMDSPSFRTVFDRLLGKYRNCDAVIVDTRFNGGGWLHNDVAQLLSGTEYARYAPRGQYIGSEPFTQWTKPSVMLVNEANYSDAYGTPYAYQALGIGELVGAPVPGTMTAVWWEQQIDPTIVFGIPEVTVLDRSGRPLENRQLQPEIEVYNTPAEITSGNDLQIKAAVTHLLNKLD